MERIWKEIRVTIVIIAMLLIVQEIVLSVIADGISDLSRTGVINSSLVVDSLGVKTIYTDSLSTNSIIVNPIMFYE